MNIRIIVGALIIAILGIATFGFINKDENKASKENQRVIESTDESASTIEPDPKERKINYVIRNRNASSSRPHKITKENIKLSKKLSDLIPDYPSQWITDYQSVDLSVVMEGEKTIASGKNDILTSEQINLIKSIEIGSFLSISVKYQDTNAATKVKEDNEMLLSLLITPEEEAEFIGGYEKMIEYLDNNGRENIQKMKFDLMEVTIINFTINEKGNSKNARVSVSSNDKEVDALLIKQIQNMPKWKPAKNSKGEYIIQDFELMIGGNMGC